MRNRASNFELFRIVTMLGIVFYHAALYSGLAEAAYADPWSLHSAAILWLGAWGKTGINCFVLLTGYFMFERRLTIGRMMKLIGLTEFYAFLVHGVQLLGDGAAVSWKVIGETSLVFIAGVGGSFVPSFIVLMLLVPILNRLLHYVTPRVHLVVAGVPLFVFSVLPSVGIKVNLGEVAWFAVLYVVAAYVRRVPLRFSWSCWRMAILACGVFALAACSMVFGAWLTARTPVRMMIYYWIFPDQKILAFLCAFTAFLFFRSLDVGRWPQMACQIVNAVASTTFGIYLLHDGVLGNTSRSWLWGHLGVTSSIASYIGFALFVFMACSGVDAARKRLVGVVAGAVRYLRNGWFR